MAQRYIGSYDDSEIDVRVCKAELDDSPKLGTCVLCGKQFVRTGRAWTRQKRCSRIHYTTCIICGKQFTFDGSGKSLADVPKCCSKECSNKARIAGMRANLQSNYGVSNPSQVPEFHDKAIQSIKAKQSQVVENRKKTMLERYGHEYAMQCQEFRDKAAVTNRIRYGYSNPAFNSEIQNKISTRLKSEEVQAKYLETAISNWGVKRPSMTAEIQDKMKSTCRERCGYEWAIQHPEIKIKASENLHKYFQDHYGVDWPSQLSEVREKQKQSMLDKYGVECGFLLPEYRLGNIGTRISKVNYKLADKLKDYGIATEFEFPIENRSYDLHIVDTKILIEINPTYTHNVIGNHWGSGVDKNYHIAKTNLAKSHGYRCINVWDWDQLDKIADLLLPITNTIYARNCKIACIDSKTTNEFLSVNHLQGSVTRISASLGLFSGDNLVAVMAFGHPRYNKNYEWEILRFASKHRCSVIGGASKLFQTFIRQTNPTSILSYCDAAKFDGHVYNLLGMEFVDQTPPNLIWSKGAKYVTNNLLNQRGYDQLFKTNFGKGMSNYDLMIQDGWLPVYDCGQYVFGWHR